MYVDSHLVRDPVSLDSFTARPEPAMDGDAFLRYRETHVPGASAEQQHADFELRLIVGTSGIVIVGDHIGTFSPGQVVLVGPNLPHRWVSLDASGDRMTLRDLAVRFPAEPMRRAANLFPELAEALPVLERACHGVEFFGLAERMRERLLRIKAFDGLRRFAEFSAVLGDLSRSTDFRLLSSVPLKGRTHESVATALEALVERIMVDPRDPPSAAEVAADIAMPQSRFSRRFLAATGRTYSDFVMRVRVAHARRRLALATDAVTAISRDTGFRNLSTFNRRFLELEGLTPSDFRRQALAQRHSTRSNPPWPA